MSLDEWNSNHQSMDSYLDQPSANDQSAQDNAFFADLKSEVIDLVLSVAIVIMFLSVLRINAMNQPALLLVIYWAAGYGIVKLIRYVIRTRKG